MPVVSLSEVFHFQLEEENTFRYALVRVANKCAPTILFSLLCLQNSYGAVVCTFFVRLLIAIVITSRAKPTVNMWLIFSPLLQKYIKGNWKHGKYVLCSDVLRRDSSWQKYWPFDHIPCMLTAPSARSSRSSRNCSNPHAIAEKVAPLFFPYFSSHCCPRRYAPTTPPTPALLI